VVIGAGFAGLSAAVRLAREGARVLVLEARGRLGGRATAFPDRETGEIVDNGQHVLLGCYRDTFDFLRDIGASDRVTLQSTLAVTMIDRQGRRSRLVCSTLPPPFHLIGGVFDWEALTWRDRLAVLNMRGPLQVARRELDPGARRIAASPGETVESWLVRNGQTDRLRELLWEPLALAALNQPPDRAAAPPFARVLGEMFGADRQAAAIGLPAVPLDVLYAEPARAYVEQRGGSVRTGTPATIRLNGDAALVASGTEQWSGAPVILAVPWYALDNTVQGTVSGLEPVLENARRMASSPIVTVNLWLDRPLFDEPFVGLPGRAMQWVFDRHTILGQASADAHPASDGSAHLSLVASGAASLVERTNAELVAQATEELFAAFPAARAARLLRSTVVREPRATFSLAPGQPARPQSRTPVRGLYLAGDWIDTGLPATIESAVRSGHQAAAAILAG
jgi:squalene-associated FAD-dependent desaturase